MGAEFQRLGEAPLGFAKRPAPEEQLPEHDARGLPCRRRSQHAPKLLLRLRELPFDLERIGAKVPTLGEVAVDPAQFAIDAARLGAPPAMPQRGRQALERALVTRPQFHRAPQARRRLGVPAHAQIRDAEVGVRLCAIGSRLASSAKAAIASRHRPALACWLASESKAPSMRLSDATG